MSLLNLISLRGRVLVPAGGLVFSIGLSLSVPAEARKQYPGVEFRNGPTAEWHADSLWLDFEAVPSRKLGSDEMLEVVPMYVAGGDTVRFPTLSFMTGSGARYRERREGAHLSRLPGITVTQGRRGFAPFTYSRCLVAPRHLDGSVEMVTVYRSCCDSVVSSSTDVPVGGTPVSKGYALGVSNRQTDRRFLKEGIETPVVEMPSSPFPVPKGSVASILTEDNVSLFEPLPEARKERRRDTEIRLEFPVNKSVIRRNLSDNAAELDRLDSVVLPLSRQIDDYDIKSVTIYGYASPEDTWDHNLELSQRRADALRDYLVDNYYISPSKIKSEGKGEDWEGLRKLMMEESFPGKAGLLDIMDSHGIFEGREKRMMDYAGGDPYKYIMSNIFPRLRRLEARIEYDVRPYDGTEAAAVIRTAPSDLSLQEVWEVAKGVNDNRRIAADRASYGGEYYLMARYFPDNVIANINASSAALVRGNLDDAWFYLVKVAESPLAANNIGLYYLLSGYPEEARAYFNIARLVDPVKAVRNLSLLPGGVSGR